MRDAGFTALEIGNVLGRQAGAVYAWAKKSGVSMQGDKAKETRQWLAQGRSLMREGTAFGVIWRDPRLELQITFCASYLEKLLELGALMKVEGAQSVYELRS